MTNIIPFFAAFITILFGVGLFLAIFQSNKTD
jgi:hypothetical protein